MTVGNETLHSGAYAFCFIRLFPHSNPALSEAHTNPFFLLTSNSCWALGSKDPII